MPSFTQGETIFSLKPIIVGPPELLLSCAVSGDKYGNPSDASPGVHQNAESNTQTVAIYCLRRRGLLLNN
jgi:hypothetical protein